MASRPGMWVGAPQDQTQAPGGVFLRSSKAAVAGSPGSSGAPVRGLDLQSRTFFSLLGFLSLCLSQWPHCPSLAGSVYLLSRSESGGKAEGRWVDISHTGLGTTLMTVKLYHRLCRPSL